MFSDLHVSSFQQRETPFFYYDLGVLDRSLQAIKTHALDKGFHVHFALKSNNNPRILSIIKEAGLGADCVSGNEIKVALDAGFTPEEIAFAGVGKTDKEIKVGLAKDIFCFNCESVQEIQVINELAGQAGKVAPIALRINPNVDAKTHKYITTGLEENKFGINENGLDKVLDLLPELEHVNLIGIHFHIGSQISELAPFERLCIRVNEISTHVEEKGFSLNHINVGGGLGINYNEPDTQAVPDFEAYFNLFEELIHLKDGQELHFEIGRAIIGQSGSLVSRVLYIKEGIETNFAIVDAGMSELIRPALYQAQHHIDVLTSEKQGKTYDVVGPICESSDTFRSRMDLPELERGDLIAIRSAGAYGQVMISKYNLRPEVGTIFSDELS